MALAPPCFSSDPIVQLMNARNSLEIHPHCHNLQFFLTFISWAVVRGTSWNPASTPGCWGSKTSPLHSQIRLLIQLGDEKYYRSAIVFKKSSVYFSTGNSNHGAGRDRSFMDDFNISTLLYSVVKGKIYLFGGCSSKNAEYCLPGVYVFDLGK